MFTNHRRFRAFTLLEICIAMAVFAIIAACVFGVMEAALRTTEELQSSQRINRQISAMVELCRKTFATLPPQADFRSAPAENNDSGNQEIVFRNAPLIFAWGGSPLNYGSATLGIRPQEDGYVSLALSRSDFAPPEEEQPPVQIIGSAPSMEPDEEGRYWLALVPDLEWVQWRFYDPGLQDWVDSWTKKTRPRLVELQLLLAGDTVPVRAVFPVSAAQTVAKK